MSMSSVLPYFRTRMESLGYVEHRDAFDFENIPENILDKAYHLTLSPVDFIDANQTMHQISFPVVVRAFFKGYSNDDSTSTLDDVIVETELIYADILSLANRLGIDIKNVTPGGFVINPVSDSNQNDLVLEMEFTAQLMCVFT